jgi:hypothetical protein
MLPRGFWQQDQSLHLYQPPQRLHNPIPAVGRIGGAVHLLSGGAEIGAAPVEPVHGVLYQGTASAVPYSCLKLN